MSRRGRCGYILRILALARASTINGSGEQTRSYVCAGDVARANVLTLRSEVLNGAYNIRTGSETSVNEFYERLRRILGTTYPRAQPSQARRAVPHLPELFEGRYAPGMAPADRP